MGDVIQCKITDIKKSFAKGEIFSIIQPSQDRIKAPCPYYGTCGGCQIQHLNDAAQSHYKLHAVIDAFQRIGRLSFPSPTFVPATIKWAYRRHITLHLKPIHGTFEAGFYTYDNDSILPIQTCPIFNATGDPIIKQVQEFVKTIPNPQQCAGRLIILKKQNQYILSFHFDSTEKMDEQLFKTALQTYPLFAGILIEKDGKSLLLGDCFAEIHLEGLQFHFTPQSFVQNHPEQSLKIYQQICALTAENGPHTVLDLYCGFGVTSLLLAQQGHRVTGIEYNPLSIQFAQENASKNGLKERAHFLQGDVEKILPHRLKEGKDLILMNPPRQGLSPKVRELIIKAQPKELIYVSCMPSTLARDLAEFCKHHYHIEKVTIYDMFPQTAHVETLVHLKLS